MVLILTFKNYEQCTGPVVDWLVNENVPFFRLNVDDLKTKDVSYVVDIINNDIRIDGISIKDQISVIWYRRFHTKLDYFKHDKQNSTLVQLNDEADSEIKTFLRYLRHFFKEKIVMPDMTKYGENKLIFLSFAKSAGLTCPETIVTNNKQELVSFYNKNEKKIISKPLYFSNYFFNGEDTYSIYTTSYGDDEINSLPESFFPTLFQKKIESIHEIRIFYLDGDFYATAAICIDKKKKIDLKLNYKSEHLHWIPYELPMSVKDKLEKFMRSVDLNTGSIDILKTKNDYVFIEVNPVGQFLAPGNHCNYYLEDEIKNWLKKKIIQN